MNSKALLFLTIIFLSFPYKSNAIRIMQMLDVKRILIPTDFSDTANLALKHAVQMARLTDAEIVLLHVVSTFAFRVNLPEAEEDEAQSNRLNSAVNRRLQEMAAEITRESGVKVSVEMAYGRIREEVVKLAEERDADMIVLGTHGVSGLKEFFMGSNAFRIVSDAGCPVLSIQESAKEVGFRKIAVPIDNSFHSREKLGIAVRIAHTYGAKLLICGLRSHDHDDETLNAKFRVKMKQVEDFLEERQVDFESTTLFCSNIAKATMDFSENQGADLIIIMNEQEINSTGFFLGPYAQQVVNHSKIPVMSIRPTTGHINSVTPY